MELPTAIDTIIVKKKKITWYARPMQKAHPHPTRIPKVDRGRWAIRTSTGWIFGVKYSFTDYDGKKLTGSMLMDAPLSLPESGLEGIVDKRIEIMESRAQAEQVEKLRMEAVKPVNEYID